MKTLTQTLRTMSTPDLQANLAMWLSRSCPTLAKAYQRELARRGA